MRDSTVSFARDSLIVAVSNILTSFFAGLVIFSIIGFLAHELNVNVDKVVDQGAGLAFIVYPEVVTRLPVSPLWSLLFFVMLLTLGLDSQFALMETVTTAILDKFPRLRQFKMWVVLSVAVFGYLGGLCFTTNSGIYWLQLMDKYAANWSVLLIASCECVLIAWVYGSERFLNDIQGMIGKQSKCWVFFWSWMWKLVTPATLLVSLDGYISDCGSLIRDCSPCSSFCCSTSSSTSPPRTEPTSIRCGRTPSAGWSASCPFSSLSPSGWCRWCAHRAN